MHVFDNFAQYALISYKFDERNHSVAVLESFTAVTVITALFCVVSEAAR
jgi:hypothetical protein